MSGLAIRPHMPNKEPWERQRFIKSNFSEAFVKSGKHFSPSSSIFRVQIKALVLN
jgi:hypothetical protein